MEIPLRTAWMYVVFATSCAFLGGRATSIYYIQNTTSSTATTTTTTTTSSNNDHDNTIITTNHNKKVTTKKEALPFPVLPGGKQFPKAKYTGMHFSETVSDYENLHIKDIVGRGLEEECTFQNDGRKQCIIDRTAGNAGTGTSTSTSSGDNVTASSKSTPMTGNDEHVSNNNGTDEEEHLPAGQHLLVDIKNVDPAFLDSEHRLAKAMVEVVTESKLTLLSYHCHKLIPMGVTCVGVLLESHISFHTWPEAGVITLDLFTCGSGKLVPVVPIIQKLFAVPQSQTQTQSQDSEVDAHVEIEEPFTKWSHTFRGFRESHQWGGLKYLTADLGNDILSDRGMEYKKEIVWAKTLFQRIDIYDTIDTPQEYEAHLRSLKKHGDNQTSSSTSTSSYEALHPEHFRPERTVFLDGVLQSTREGLAAYHEALVQPAMFTHPNPRRVAIIGGGEGATLREVLKHNTIDVVKMIEIDEKMVKVSRKHLPEWNSCDDFIGSDVKWCGDDDRADMYYEDAIEWFKKRFTNDFEEDEELTDDDDNEDVDVEEPFDVLIMDALDPQDSIPFAEILYTDENFVRALYDALSDNGVIVLQLGNAPYSRETSDENPGSERRASLIELMEDVGFEEMRVYEDGNCGFDGPWMFLIGMKSHSNKENWFISSAELEVEIHNRILRTRSGRPALQYFDSGVKNNYLFPPRALEITYCRSTPKPESCTLLEQRYGEKIPNVPVSDLEVRMSGVGDGSGRGLFTKVDIKKGSKLGAEVDKYKVLFNPSSTELAENYKDIGPSAGHPFRYIDSYGWMSGFHGDETFLVETSIMTFSNHGCNGTYNFYNHFNGQGVISEQNAVEDDFEDEDHDDVYDPVLYRHSAHLLERTTRDIKAGEEILSNYLWYTDDEDHWWDWVTNLRRICNGEGLGSVTQLEMESQNKKEKS